jgi:hypothetical protein
MLENDVTAVDIASFLKMNPATITRYLDGLTIPRRSTVDGLNRFIAWFSNQKQATAGGIKATG